MFGEYESESPRVPSPWDSLMSSPRSLSPSKSNGHCNGNLATNVIQTSISPLQLSLSPLLLPRLVPENDSGNVEYKLHLLNPSPARFTRLVTQLKWRLLEGGGQAYYELGVADSGDLVGLGRQELESSLDTLEMMAGEIGASVIVVKEIEVPVELAAQYEEDAKSRGQTNTWGDARGKRARRREKELMTCLFDNDLAAVSSMSLASTTNTETEDSSVAGNDDNEDMQMTIILQRPMASCYAASDLADSTAMFSIDLESEFDPADAADVSETDDDKLTPPSSQYAIHLQISSVCKPRPMRKRFHHIHPGQHHHQNGSGRSMGKKGKNGKEKHPHHNNHVQKDPPTVNSDTSVPTNRTSLRRQARDRRREDRKQALLALASRAATEAANTNPTPTATSEPPENVQVAVETLVEEFEALHVYAGSGASPGSSSNPIISVPFTTTTTTTTTTLGSSNATVVNTPPADGTAHRTTNNQDITGDSGLICNEDDDEGIFGSPIMPASTPKPAEVTNTNKDTRSIAEVLVVRKLSIEEGFLDFEGFSFL